MLVDINTRQEMMTNKALFMVYTMQVMMQLMVRKNTRGTPDAEVVVKWKEI